MQTFAHPIQGADQEAVDRAYLDHHFNCPQCIAAARGAQYGMRCDVGAPLWMTYVGIAETQPEEAEPCPPTPT